MSLRDDAPHPKREAGRGELIAAGCVLALAIALVTAVRLHRLDLPLERDEGEYAYGARLILDRAFSYADFHTMKLPGVPAMAALFFACFGATREALHAGLLVVDVASMLLLFTLGKRLFGPLAGASSATAFGLLEMGRSVFGLCAHAEHFAVLFATAGVLAVFSVPTRAKPGRWLLGGLLFGLAFLMKQQALPIAAVGIYAIVVHELGAQSRSTGRALRRGATFAAGLLGPYALVAVFFAASGSFASFWFWTVTCGSVYVARVPLAQGLEYLAFSTSAMLREAPFVWVVAAVGAGTLAAFGPWRSTGRFLAVYAAASFVAVCPGLFFRNHYMVLVLPPAALLFGAGLSAVSGTLARAAQPGRVRAVHVASLSIACGATVFGERAHLFVQTPAEVVHDTFPGNPFQESLEIARVLKLRAGPGDTVAILGSEPQIPFYAGLRSTTGFLYSYPLMEEHAKALELQKEMMNEIEARAPRFLVYVNVPGSWSRRPRSSSFVFSESARLWKEHYRKIGVAEVLAHGSRFWWNAEVADAKPSSECYVVVYERIR